MNRRAPVLDAEVVADERRNLPVRVVRPQGEKAPPIGGGRSSRSFRWPLFLTPAYPQQHPDQTFRSWLNDRVGSAIERSEKARGGSIGFVVVVWLVLLGAIFPSTAWPALLRSRSGIYLGFVSFALFYGLPLAALAGVYPLENLPAGTLWVPIVLLMAAAGACAFVFLLAPRGMLHIAWRLPPLFGFAVLSVTLWVTVASVFVSAPEYKDISRRVFGSPGLVTLPDSFWPDGWNGDALQYAYLAQSLRDSPDEVQLILSKISSNLGARQSRGEPIAVFRPADVDFGVYNVVVERLSQAVDFAAMYRANGLLGDMPSYQAVQSALVDLSSLAVEHEAFLKRQKQDDVEQFRLGVLAAFTAWMLILTTSSAVAVATGTSGGRAMVLVLVISAIYVLPGLQSMPMWEKVPAPLGGAAGAVLRLDPPFSAAAAEQVRVGSARAGHPEGSEQYCRQPFWHPVWSVLSIHPVPRHMALCGAAAQNSFSTPGL